MGHEQRVATKKKIKRLLELAVESLDENFRALVKKGPVSVETSLKELEEIYAGGANWKKIKEGGILSIPLGSSHIKKTGKR